MRFVILKIVFPRFGNILMNWSTLIEMHFLVQRLTLKNADHINRYLVISSDHESDTPRIYQENTWHPIINVIAANMRTIRISSRLSSMTWINFFMQSFLLPSYNFFDIQIRSFIIISYQFSLFFQCKCKEKTGCQKALHLTSGFCYLWELSRYGTSFSKIRLLHALMDQI